MPTYTSPFYPNSNSSSSRRMAIQQQKSGMFARAQALIDLVVSPSTRQQFYSNIATFSNEQPLLAVCPCSRNHHNFDRVSKLKLKLDKVILTCNPTLDIPLHPTPPLLHAPRALRILHHRCPSPLTHNRSLILPLLDRCRFTRSRPYPLHNS